MSFLAERTGLRSSRMLFMAATLLSGTHHGAPDPFSRMLFADSPAPCHAHGIVYEAFQSARLTSVPMLSRIRAQVVGLVENDRLIPWEKTGMAAALVPYRQVRRNRAWFTTMI